jgi:hypothetical protein
MGSSTGEDLHVLCHQHHQKMLPRFSSESTKSLLHVCQEQECSIRYDSLTGYFIDTTDKRALEREILPRVRCSSDERPMYLAEVHPERKSSRLWKCPECGSTRTNEEFRSALGKQMGA